MQTSILALLIAAVFSVFVPGVQRILRGIGPWIWAAPPLLTAVFGGAAAVAGVYSPALVLMVLVYTLAPVLCVVLTARHRPSGPPQALDFLAILLLWLPIEFGAGQTLISRPAQGFLHSVAYGIAILLGLTLFVGFRKFPGLKYNLPCSPRDLWLPLAGFALLAPVLIAVGIPIGFLPPPHLPTQTGGRMAAALGIIFAATALPEEILFRAHPEPAHAAIRNRGAHARRGQRDLRVRPPRQWAAAPAELALCNSRDDRWVGLWKGVREVQHSALFGRSPHTGRLDQAFLFLDLCAV
jgi:hypothetical protein